MSATLVYASEISKILFELAVFAWVTQLYVRATHKTALGHTLMIGFGALTVTAIVFHIFWIYLYATGQTS